jgi:hypothetical protein
MKSTIRTAVAAGLLLAAASCGAPEDDQVDPVQAAHHQLRCKAGPADVPPGLVPDGVCLQDQALGTGVQIYTCTAGAWVLKAPEANLTDRHGRFQGNHFLGPTWQWNDGSKIHAAKTAQVAAPDPTAVAWLLLAVTSEEGDGELADITHVQRVHTTGGVAPAGPCAPEASEVRVPYTADYIFYGPPRRW